MLPLPAYTSLALSHARTKRRLSWLSWAIVLCACSLGSIVVDSFTGVVVDSLPTARRADTWLHLR